MSDTLDGVVSVKQVATGLWVGGVLAVAGASAVYDGAPAADGELVCAGVCFGLLGTAVLLFTALRPSRVADDDAGRSLVARLEASAARWRA